MKFLVRAESLVPGTWYLVLVHGTWYLVLGTWCVAPGIWSYYQVPDIWYLVPGTTQDQNLISQYQGLLPLIQEAIVSLLWPFEWHLTLIPILPDIMF